MRIDSGRNGQLRLYGEYPILPQTSVPATEIAKVAGFYFTPTSLAAFLTVLENFPYRPFSSILLFNQHVVSPGNAGGGF